MKTENERIAPACALSDVDLAAVAGARSTLGGAVPHHPLPGPVPHWPRLPRHPRGHHPVIVPL